MAHKILSWGKCTAKVTPISGYKVSAEKPTGDTTPIEFKKIVQGSTTLESSEGEKTEARIEGGAIEAVNQLEDSYTLTFQERIGSSDDIRIENHNGVVDGVFKVEVIPANKSAKKLTVAECSCHVGKTFTSADGIIVTYTFSSLDADADGDGDGDQQISFDAQV